VLGERHNQLDHTDGKKKYFGVSGFRSQYLVLAKDARFRLRQYPLKTLQLPGGPGRAGVEVFGLLVSLELHLACPPPAFRLPL